jgi:hypothetical protein
MVQTTQHIHFDYDNNRYRVELDTDILAEYGIDVTAYGGKLFGTIYFNGSINQQHITAIDPLIDLESGAVVSSWYNLPTDSAGNIVNGTWTGSVSFHLEATGLDISTIVAPDTINMDGYGELADFFLAGDQVTIPTGPNAGTKTITSVTGDVSLDLEIIVSNTLTDESPTGATISFDVTHDSGTLTHTYRGCTLVTLDPMASFDCDSTTYGTFTGYDNTNYGEQTLVTTTLRIIHPSWTIIPYSTSDSVTTQDSPISKTLTQLYTGEWYVRLTSSIEYTQTDGAVISYTLTKTISEQVTCAGTLCGMTACIKNLLTNVVADINKTGVSANLGNLLIVLTNYDLAKEYLRCGNMADYRTALAAISAALSDSDCDCNCCDDTVLIRIENVDADTATAITDLELAVSKCYKIYNGVPDESMTEEAGYPIGVVLQNYNTGVEYQHTSDDVSGDAVWTVYDNDTKVIKLLATQSGTSAPTFTVLRNDTDETPTGGYTATGIYTLTMTGQFTASKTLILAGNNYIASLGTFNAVRTDTDTITMTTTSSGAAANGVLSETTLIIEISKL